MKVLYIFAGIRGARYQGVASKDFADTQLYGFNHMAALGVDAAYTEPNSAFGGVLAQLLGFRLRHFLMFFATTGYDVFFGSAILYMLFWKKLLRSKRKFVILNLNLVRLLESNTRASVKGALLRWLLKSADGIVNVARFQQEYLEQVVPALRGRMCSLKLGVDIAYYEPHRPRKEYLLAVGRDTGRDYKTVFAVARLLPERQFIILCSERNLKQLGLAPSNVTVHLDRPARPFYEEAQALLLITHSDQFTEGADCSGQTVLLDAMASGCPVIATRRAYLVSGEYAEEGKEALFVDAYDVDGICKSIRRLDDAALRTTLSRCARAKAESLSTARMAKDLVEYFNHVLAR